MQDKITFPLRGTYPITFKFGEAPDWYIKEFGYPHNGIDIGAPDGTPVLATDDGVVSYADNIPDSSGCGIFLTHDWGQSEYWHLSVLSVRFGDHVAKGSVIGYSGHTGFASGPHLHFGIKVAGDSPANMRGWSDPEKYLNSVPVPTPPPPPVSKTYTVVSGDSLWKIAEKMYGQGYQWPKIYDANKTIIANPNIITPGMVLTIP